MKTQIQNLFLLEANPLTSNRIVAFLNNKFPNSLKISTFENGDDLLKFMNKDISIVILDYDIKEAKTNVILQKIKKINAQTEVIVLSSDEDIANSIESYRKGANNFVAKNGNALNKIQFIISKIIYYPAAIIQRYFGFKELVAIFIVELLYIILFVLVGFQILQ
jgi:DNA-binding NarL/FixJ family response regulator